MTMKPLGDRVVIEPSDPTKTSIAGFETARGSQERPTEGSVVAVGSKVEEVKVGDMVYFTRYATTEISVAGKTYYSLKEEQIEGTLE